MKKILIPLGVTVAVLASLLFVSFPAHSEDVGSGVGVPQGIFYSGYNTAAVVTNPAIAGRLAGLVGQVTTTVNAQVNFPLSSQFSCQVVISNTAATTSNSTLTFDSSVDGVNWSTATAKILIASLGTLTANCVSNFTQVGAVPYWRLASIANGAANTTTASVTVVVIKKSGL